MHAVSYQVKETGDMTFRKDTCSHNCPHEQHHQETINYKWRNSFVYSTPIFESNLIFCFVLYSIFLVYEAFGVEDLKLPELPADFGCNLPVRTNKQF
jgi:hypothetical protein